MLKRHNQAIQTEIGELRANTIRANDLYVVGHDIKSGTWHTIGDGSLNGGSNCAYAVYSSPNKPSITTFSRPLDGQPVWRLCLPVSTALHVDTRAVVTGPTCPLIHENPGHSAGEMAGGSSHVDNRITVTVGSNGRGTGTTGSHHQERDGDDRDR
jgi:hypothetical protein